MTSLQPILIGGYPGGGLTTDKKPFLLQDEAYSLLMNAYVWRNRTRRRLGSVTLGRLQRNFTNIDFFTTGAANWTFNLLTRSGYVTAATNGNPGAITTAYPHGLSTGDEVVLSNVAGATGYNGKVFTITVTSTTSFTTGTNAAGYGAYTGGGYFISNLAWGTLDPYAQVVPGSFSITFSATAYTDNGQGSIVDSMSNVVGTINYITGSVTLTNTGLGGASTTITFYYYPAFQSMAICKQDIATIGIDNTIFFDTTYAYQYVAGTFQELAPGTIWTGPNNTNGTNTYFFYYANYQGVDAYLKYFFATNFYINTGSGVYDPIRYYYNSTWTALTPLVTSSIYMFQALILVPYYGRLVALNTYEGTAANAAQNFYARCRFSQRGTAVGTDSWRQDIFGLGGYVDAPTNETIVGAAFYRNTLIVFFEYSTWQLRYIGEYGIPFIFERISSDFGAVSTFSPIIFDQGVMAIGDRGIIQAGAQGVKRLDEQIPETIFSFEIENNAPDFVHGIRDFEKEVVYWNYIDATGISQSSDDDLQNFPNSVLLYNYRNNTWATFRDTITCFGTGQFNLGITWDSDTTEWDEDIPWDDSDQQAYSDYILAGNQHGFIQIYENQEVETPTTCPIIYGPTLFIYAVDFSEYPGPVQLTVPNHNLFDGELIFIMDLIWSGTDPGMNNMIYQITVIDVNTISLSTWNGSNYQSFAVDSDATYLGGGVICLLPVMNMQSKDFNPFQEQGKQFKLSFIDMQIDSDVTIPSIPAVTVQLFVNAALNEQANTFSYSNQELLYSSQNCSFITNVYTGTNTPTNPSNPCTVISPNHGLNTGTLIYIANILGTTQLNGLNYTITVVNANAFTLNGIDASSGYSTYIKGGIWNAQPVDGQTYNPSSQYAWYRFYSNQFGQYLRFGLTFDDLLMNQIATHQGTFELNDMNLWMKEGGRLVN